MDGRRTAATAAGCAAMIAAAFGLGRCTAPQAAATPTATAVVGPVDATTWDTNRWTAQALDQLTIWINSTTTTTAPPPPPVTQPSTPTSSTDFFTCVRWRESRNDYTAVSASGTFRGAYQWYQQGWDHFAAQVAPTYVGTPPDQAPPAIQDLVSETAYQQLGAAPWGGACQ